MTRFGRTAQYQGRNMKKVGNVLESTGKSMMTHITLPTAIASGAMAKMAIDTESSFNGIRKTVDATEKQFQQLEKNFDNMSLEIPVDLTELHHYGELAGQLGVKAKDITKFSKTIAELNVSTNLVGEEGASSLAKFSNIMGMNLDNIDKLGSSIVHLGNNTSTTEADIVEMAMRLAGAGKQINLTEAQVMGISSTLSSLGIQAEAGGTAFSKVMLNINNQVMSNGKFLDYYAKICGTTEKKFKNIWKKDSMKGLEMFSDGLNRFKKQGGNLSLLLDTIGYKDIRVKDTLLRLSTTQGQLTKNVELGTKAWNENVALQNEANVRFRETAGQIKLMKNHLKLLGKTTGKMFLPYIKKATKYISNFSDKIQKLSPEQQRAIVKFALMASGISVAVFAIGKLTGKIASAITGVSKFIRYVRKLGGVMAFLTSPAMIVVGVLTLIAIATYLIIKNWKKIKKVFKDVAKSIGKHTGITKGHIVKLYNIIKRYTKIIVSRIGKSVKRIKSKILPPLKRLVATFKRTFAKLKPIIMPILKFLTGVFIVKIMYTFNIVSQIISIAIDVISGIIGGLIDVFGGIITYIVGVFTLDWGMAWNGLKQVFNGICEIIRSIWDGIIDFFSAPVNAVLDILDGIFHDKVQKAKKVWEGLKTFFKHPIKASMSLYKHGDLRDVKTDGSHATGSKRIPYNGYLAELHQDEKVLTKQEAREYEQRKNGNGITINISKMEVREESDIDKIATALAQKLQINNLNFA